MGPTLRRLLRPKRSPTMTSCWRSVCLSMRTLQKSGGWRTLQKENETLRRAAEELCAEVGGWKGASLAVDGEDDGIGRRGSSEQRVGSWERRGCEW
ncbi:hypothetical protein B296_00016548 [Ensete ventricosum]|uniref:Uncharacterized protein n=1 Tax=Ensete ventricosum TaxID=4639 RepID=A0A426XRY8_ENSVE|nr:hypothetical protein B296_00016548 [Ensete ventricosum]